MRFRRAGWALAALLASLSCGGGSHSDGIVDRSTGSHALFVTVSDAPSDRFEVFTLTFNSVALISTAGSTVELVSKPVQLELLHRTGHPSPVFIGDIPDGTYTSVKLSITRIDSSYIRDRDGTEVSGPGLTITGSPVTVNLSPALQVGPDPAALNIDVNLNASLLSLDQNSNTGTFHPVVSVVAGTIAPKGTQTESTGLISEFMGTISAISSGGFTLHSAQTFRDLEFTTDPSTEVSGITAISQLSTGMLVTVDATMGSTKPTATKVRVLAPNGGYGGNGLMTYGLGSIVGQVVESSSVLPCIGCLYFMNADVNTRFEIEPSVDVSGLSYASFAGVADFHIGQRLQFATISGTGSSLTPTLVQLRDQCLSGTFTGPITPSGSDQLFTLQLPAESYLGLLTHTTTLTVVQRSGTKLSTSLANGASLHVHGLLFYDSAGGQYKMVASQIEAAN